MATLNQFIFFDFEMLCSNRGMSFDQMEAIRLGAVKYDLTTGNVSYFDRFIKPNSKKPLSAFCKSLTGISDEDLKEADNFHLVFQDFLTWIGGVKRSRFFSWSPSDLTRLKIDSKNHYIATTTISKIEKRYIDFQAIFTKRVSKTHFSVENALKLYGLEFSGEKHNPMYDAYNTLRIYLSFQNHPLQTDLIMINQFILEEMPNHYENINDQILQSFKIDLENYTSVLHDIYRMKDASKMIRKTRKIVEKYENILMNRSGLFSQVNIDHVRLLVDFYHNLLFSYEEHFNYSSKIMILADTIIQPINKLLVKRG